jgi:hypothetical protein
MYNITLICTRHSELGACNSTELFKIIERIKPDLIFEEIPPSYFNKYYITKIQSNLETDTINKYVETHNIKHIPVDSDNLPYESFFQDHKNMLERIEGLADINGFNYRTLTDTNRINIKIYGFRYLNSIQCVNYNNAIYSAIEKGLQNINDEKLFQTYNLWKDINEKRENVMLQNIYSYSKEQCYDKAIFTIGSGHRKTISLKIEEYKNQENLKLNWNFCNNEVDLE